MNQAQIIAKLKHHGVEPKDIDFTVWDYWVPGISMSKPEKRPKFVEGFNLNRTPEWKATDIELPDWWGNCYRWPKVVRVVHLKKKKEGSKMKYKYIVLWNQNAKPVIDDGAWEVRGFTKTFKQAQKLVKDDCGADFDGADGIQIGRNATYTGPYIITKIESITLPVPVVDFKIELEDCELKEK